MKIDYTFDAERDIESAVDALAVDCGANVAALFKARLDGTLARLAAMPESVALIDPPFPRFPGLRVVPVRKFAARLVFFTVTDAGILIVRVLPAGSDWPGILGE